VGGAVHERLSSNNSAAAITRCSLSAIGVKGVREVARLTIHVHILAIKTCPTLGEGFGQHGSNSAKSVRTWGRQALRGGSVVQLCSPEGLIGIDVADSTDQVLIEQCPLEVGVFRSKRPGESCIVKSWIEGIARNVSNRSWEFDYPLSPCPRGDHPRSQ
jgi:hypothetical protein